MKERKLISLVKICVWFVIVLLLILLASFFLKPSWREWNNYNTMHGFYEEPRNTIETIFLGASTVVNGITPMELYEDTGICAYNLGTEQQPMLASYYWTEEAYRLHKETLKTVVLDVKELYHTPDDAFFHKALDGMRFSDVKWRAVKDLTPDLNDRMTYLFPLFSYHRRWEELGKLDFDKSGFRVNRASRGYNLEAVRYLNTGEADSLLVPRYIQDPDAPETVFDKNSLHYLKKTIDFCQKNQLHLVLIKTPDISGWGDSETNAMKKLEEIYGLEFYDFNYLPLLDEILYNAATDTTDARHMNYYGAKKLTAWMSGFLTEKCGATDVRGNKSYAFMEKELEEYYEHLTTHLEQVSIKEPAEYLKKALEHPGNVIFLTVKDEASNSLTEKQRNAFAEMGLKELSELEYRDSYLGILEEGKLICEKRDRMEDYPELSEKLEKPEEENSTKLVNALDGDWEEPEEKEEKLLYLKQEGMLNDGTTYSLTSGGCFLGNISSCKVNNTEMSPNGRGLNIVIYNKKDKMTITGTCFDTYASSERDGNDLEMELTKDLEEGKPLNDLPDSLKKLYRYNQRCAIKRMLAELKAIADQDGFLLYIDTLRQRENTRIYLSVKDEASAMISDYAGEALRKLGLKELADLSFRDSYLAILEDGEVTLEQTDHGDSPLTLDEKGFYSLASGGCESGNTSSICLNGVEYSPNERGINVVVYDTENREVIDTTFFDTYAYPMTVPEELR